MQKTLHLTIWADCTSMKQQEEDTTAILASVCITAVWWKLGGVESGGWEGWRGWNL